MRQNLSTDLALARFTIRHHSLRRGYDGDAQAVLYARDLIDLRVLSLTRLAVTIRFADRRLAVRRH